MTTFRTFILRFLIILFPAFLASFALVNFQTLTKLEIMLLSLLSLGMPWLFYELLLHHDHQSRANKALIRFCTSMERLLTGVTYLEKTSQESPREVMAELRIMQNIMERIIKEKEEKQQSETKPAETNSDTTLSATPAEISSTEKPDFSPQSPTQEDNVIEINKDIKTASQPSSTHDKKAKPLTRAQLLNIIEKALNSDRIEMLIQPIVSLPQRKARHFECFSRIREEDGTIYTPDHFLHLAEEENLIRLVDNAMLFRCIQMARASVKKNFDVNFL